MSFGRDTWVCDPVIWRLGGCCPPYLATQRWHSSADGALVNCNPRIDTLGERANDPNRVLGRALASCTYPEPHLRSVTITTERSCLNEFLRHIESSLASSKLLSERGRPPPPTFVHICTDTGAGFRRPSWLSAENQSVGAINHVTIGSSPFPTKLPDITQPTLSSIHPHP